MRLGQLARKLAMRPAEIVAFLAENNIHIDEGGNTKLEDSHLTFVLQKFAPDTLTDSSFQLDAPGEDNLFNQAVPAPLSVEIDLEPLPLPPSGKEEADEKLETIKAPKVELSGLKVLGKIDLPEPKKKESLEEQPATDESKKISAENRNSNQRRPQSQRSRINPIAIEREKETAATKEKREEEAKLQKERRTQNYLRKVKAPQPTKSVRLIDEPVMQMSSVELTDPPKTWWRKFIKWLNT